MPKPTQPMFCLTVKRDGGTQDVVGFYGEEELSVAILNAQSFLLDSIDLKSRRAIIRLEYYNPNGSTDLTL